MVDKWRVEIMQTFIVYGVDGAEDAIDAARGALDMTDRRSRQIHADMVDASFIARPHPYTPSLDSMMHGLSRISERLDDRIAFLENVERLRVQVPDSGDFGVGLGDHPAVDEAAAMGVEPQGAGKDVGAPERPVVGGDQGMGAGNSGLGINEQE